MNARNIFKHLRGAAGHAVVWGACWATLSAAVLVVLKGGGFFFPDDVSWLDAIVIAAQVGFVGGITGGTFSLAISALYPGRRPSDIGAARCGPMGRVLGGCSCRSSSSRR